MKNKSQIVMYKTEDGQTKIDVRFDGGTVWLNQDEIALLFGKGRSTIVEHISNVFKEGELIEKSVCREFRRTGTDGKIVDVVVALTDSAQPDGYIKDMRRRDEELSKGWGQIATPLLIEYIQLYCRDAQFGRLYINTQ